MTRCYKILKLALWWKAEGTGSQLFFVKYRIISSAHLWMSGMSAICFNQFRKKSATSCPNNQQGHQSRKQETWPHSSISTLFMSVCTLGADLCVLSGCVCVPTILWLFVIKLVQTCRARQPRAVTHTPSLLTKKEKTSLNYIHPLGVSFCSKQTSEPPPQPSGHKPNRGLMERTFWWTRWP